MAEKAPYRTSFKLTSARPDAINQALAKLHETCSTYEQSGEASATLTLESWKEAPLQAIIEEFEFWLYRYEIGIECEVKIQRPGVRPETITGMRATRTTPMDRKGWEAPRSAPVVPHGDYSRELEQLVEEAADDRDRSIDEEEEEARLAEGEGEEGVVSVLALDDGSVDDDGEEYSA